MKAFIYVGGSIRPEHITEHPKEGDLLIAADSGLKNALALHETPSLFIGDCDSFPEKMIPAGTEKIMLKPEKDDTDTQAAVELAISQGADDIVIIGGLDGRLDHTMANMNLLEDLYERGIHGVILNGQNRVHFLKDTSTLIPTSSYKYLALIPIDKVVKGVDIEGCKYPLHHAKLKRTNTALTVSNELTGNCALVSVRKGSVFIIESCDN